MICHCSLPPSFWMLFSGGKNCVSGIKTKDFFLVLGLIHIPINLTSPCHFQKLCWFNLVSPLSLHLWLAYITVHVCPHQVWKVLWFHGTSLCAAFFASLLWRVSFFKMTVILCDFYFVVDVIEARFFYVLLHTKCT